MHFTSIANVFGKLLIITGSSMILPIICSLYYGGADLRAILVSGIITVACGLPLWWVFRHRYELNIKDGFFIAVFGWVLISAISALPFMIHGSIPSFTDAFFEMMSGYTTSGATILTDIEVVPHGLLFWRSQTHLLGGMGFLTLTVIFLPHGMGGLRIFRAESSPGQVITKEKFIPRNRNTMIWLWGIYMALNVLETILLSAGGMSLFDSLCHSFGTVSTSGYSPWNASIGHYNNAYFDWVIILFMFLGGMTFMLFYHMLMGNWNVLRINTEFRWYLGFMLFFCGMVSWILWRENTYGGLMEAIRYGTFQVTSILTTTGFTTADYEKWPQAAQMFLYAVCFIGACAGSTTSGIKIVHYVIICKFMAAAIKKLFLQPMSVISVRMNQRPVDDSIIYLSVCYFIVNIFLVLGGGCFMVLVDDMDYVTGMSSVIATLMNIGPGFGAIGPAENYAHISDVGKWFLSWNMLVGRLEMFSALVVFYPSFWKR
ncbi:Trk potassium uptake system protein TrkH [Olavius algarvensis associated proteobacterium Delta 3]|nr:Trk potassium uptake system protein TrkH [Olavius algarvensis associated proteobacterium Delta 3]CAB5142482.1 Trk potassium uptake system protein TrkH [Olavius algarvensis associated proteobacterium Delta 3]